VRIVEEAAAMLEQEGDAGLEHVGAIRFGDGNYVFVNTLDGVTLMHLQPHLIGRSLLHLKDDTGKYFFQDFAEVVKSKEAQQDGEVYYVGSGWVRYRWPRPSDQVIVPKETYVKGARMGDKNVYVGAGIEIRE
jgi:methyl-accepting chemotaxis protein